MTNGQTRVPIVICTSCKHRVYAKSVDPDGGVVCAARVIQVQHGSRPNVRCKHTVNKNSFEYTNGNFLTGVKTTMTGSHGARINPEKRQTPIISR